MKYLGSQRLVFAYSKTSSPVAPTFSFQHSGIWRPETISVANVFSITMAEKREKLLKIPQTAGESLDCAPDRAFTLAPWGQAWDL